ncbi:MAG: hypothetical protein AAB426_12365 [Myxococcota bacterium]
MRTELEAWVQTAPTRSDWPACHWQTLAELEATLGARRPRWIVGDECARPRALIYDIATQAPRGILVLLGEGRMELSSVEEVFLCAAHEAFGDAPDGDLAADVRWVLLPRDGWVLAALVAMGARVRRDGTIPPQHLARVDLSRRAYLRLVPPAGGR